MTSHCPLNSESISRFPYVDRISVREKEDQVDFVYQYVKDCDVFLTHNDTEHYMLGKPINFPKYGNFPETFTTVCVFFGYLLLLHCPIENKYNLKPRRFFSIGLLAF